MYLCFTTCGQNRHGSAGKISSKISAKVEIKPAVSSAGHSERSFSNSIENGLLRQNLRFWSSGEAPQVRKDENLNCAQEVLPKSPVARRYWPDVSTNIIRVRRSELARSYRICMDSGPLQQRYLRNNDSHSARDVRNISTIKATRCLIHSITTR